MKRLIATPYVFYDNSHGKFRIEMNREQECKHHFPHVHIFKGKDRFHNLAYDFVNKVVLEDSLNRNISSKQLNKLFEWCHEHCEQLKEMWNNNDIYLITGDDEND